MEPGHTHICHFDHEDNRSLWQKVKDFLWYYPWAFGSMLGFAIGISLLLFVDLVLIN